MASMQYDVSATKPLTSTGLFKDQNNNDLARMRIKAVYAVCGDTAGSVVFKDGSGGETLLTLNTPASSECGFVFINLPGEGIVSATTLYATITTTASVVVFYG